ncbi:lish domain-containing protein fopnl [Plasmopara halstedii]|uniref:Centrosomal protein 20 n=1 Tax=Plasmopara halstedii TaxID=4781 RepID=A0A0P1AKI7_PLAHL|nr:lish domain-containing protein fopnl [Plasmopara halstedii]CEG41772.1 lish domain-containing protein fopnl [Plasmopara halstedii]|eukprot:XP_024578141.1 lish domain-containing protein fopnl [Plasmopara halstedii]
MSDGGQATLSDLKEVLKDTLAARGSLDQIKARIRAEIFAALDDQNLPKPKLSNENLIINELIREYFEYNNYRHALSVFLPESGQPAEKPFDRHFLSSELNITDDPRFTRVPLLYSIVASLQQNRNQANLRERDYKNEHQINKYAALPGNNDIEQAELRKSSLFCIGALTRHFKEIAQLVLMLVPM